MAPKKRRMDPGNTSQCYFSAVTLRSTMNKATKRLLPVQGWVAASALLLAVAALSKGFGFFREVLIANYFGASGVVDAFSIAYAIPLLAAGGIGFAFSMALIAKYHQVLIASGKDAATSFLVSMHACCLMISIIVMMPLWIMPNEIVRLVAPGLPPGGAQLAGELLRWLCVYVLSLNVVNLLAATFHVWNHFKVPALGEIGFNAVTIIVLVCWATGLGIHALVLGNLLGNVLCIGLLLGVLVKHRTGIGIRHVRQLNLWTPICLVLPIWGYAICGHLVGIIANYFASGLREGSVAAFGYAKTISAAMVTLVTLNLARGVFPTFAALSSAEQSEEGRALLLALSKVIILFFVPVSVLLAVFRREVLGAFYLRGAFSVADLDTTSTVFLYFAITLVVAALEPIFVRTCFTFADAKTPLLATLAGSCVMVPLMAVLTPLMGIAGIGLSAALGLLIDVTIQVLVLDRRFQGLFAGELAQCLLRSSVCAASLLPLLFLWPAENTTQACVSMLVYLGCYAALARYVSRDGVGALSVIWRRGVASIS